MIGKHRRTLTPLFAVPTRGNMRFAAIEAVIAALGGELHEGAGSRVALELRGQRVYLHRPHPGHEAKRYQAEEVREFLWRLEIWP